MWIFFFHVLLLLGLTIPATFLISLLDQLEWSPVKTTSVYTAPHLQRQIFCGTNELLIINRNIILLGHNGTSLQRHKIFSPFHDVITDFDTTSPSIHSIYFQSIITTFSLNFWVVCTDIKDLMSKWNTLAPAYNGTARERIFLIAGWSPFLQVLPWGSRASKLEKV